MVATRVRHRANDNARDIGVVVENVNVMKPAHTSARSHKKPQTRYFGSAPTTPTRRCRQHTYGLMRITLCAKCVATSRSVTSRGDAPGRRARRRTATESKKNQNQLQRNTATAPAQRGPAPPPPPRVRATDRRTRRRSPRGAHATGGQLRAAPAVHRRRQTQARAALSERTRNAAQRASPRDRTTERTSPRPSVCEQSSVCVRAETSATRRVHATKISQTLKVSFLVRRSTQQSGLR